MSDRVIDVIGLVVAAAILSIFLTFVFSEKRIEFYYVNSRMAHASEVASVSCVYAHFPWETDNAVFCSADPEKTLSVLRQANEDLEKVKSKHKGVW